MSSRVEPVFLGVVPTEPHPWVPRNEDTGENQVCRYCDVDRELEIHEAPIGEIPHWKP